MSLTNAHHWRLNTWLPAILTLMSTMAAISSLKQLSHSPSEPGKGAQRGDEGSAGRMRRPHHERCAALGAALTHHNHIARPDAQLVLLRVGGVVRQLHVLGVRAKL